MTDPSQASSRTRARRGAAAAAILRPMFVDVVERDHQETDAAHRRRQIVVAVTLVLGATLLGLSLSVRPGDRLFYYLTFALAAVWVVGGLLSGPLHLGRLLFRGRLRYPIVTPIGVGLVVSAVFVVGSLIVREIPAIRGVVVDVLDHASEGSLPLIAAITIVNGIAEEIFFRGALFAAIGRKRAVLLSSVAYVVATMATGNPMLVFAAILLSPLLGLQRRSTGGVLAP
ncbi:MAG: abortive infection protein, partial [Jatrophihabitantaceae bacterium]|nr:abortive infection protein [Jatrophihabitantaceae bacterium]